MGFLNLQTVLYATSALILLPFFTYYVTSTLFHRRVRSEARNKVPPTVPYQAPGVFHAFGLATIGPQKYLAQLIKDYGRSGPFFFNAGPQSFLVVCGPKHVNKVCAAIRAITPAACRLEMFDKLYSSPPAALDLYAGKSTSEADRSALYYAHVDLVQKHLTGSALFTNVETYISTLSANLNNKMFQVGSWTQIEDTWAFFQQVTTHCLLVSLFGTDLFKQYPRVVKDYWEFSDATEGFIPGLPRYWVPGAAAKVQERLHQGIERWLKANLSGSESARFTDEDPAWDDDKGSKFVQERDHILGTIELIDTKARAAEILCIMHETLSTVVPCLLWSLLEVVRRPQLAEKFVAEISRYRPSHDATYNVQDIARLSLIESILAETVRIRTATIGVLNNSKELVLDDHWTVPVNSRIITFSHDVALNTSAWVDARPQAVEKPLEEYWPERFILQERTASGVGLKGQGRNIGATSFSMEGLESLNTAMGVGQSPVLGREYTRGVHAATMAVLFSEFDMQLCDAESFDAAISAGGEAAFGMLRPLDKVAIRIRKRGTKTR